MSLAITSPYDVLAIATVVLLVLGGTLRLTRLITTDDLGAWFLRDPLERWAQRAERAKRQARQQTIDAIDPADPQVTPEAVLMLSQWQEEVDDPSHWLSWQGRLVSGLSCPFCVGFWVGLGVMLITVFLPPLTLVWAIWLLLLAALSLNYVAGHISARLD